MSNKLKNVFSNHMFEMGGKIRFKDEESSVKFAEALKLVYEEGRPVEIDGVEAVETGIKDGSTVYPPMVHRHIDKFIVDVSRQAIPLKIETSSGTKEINLEGYHTANEFVVETNRNGVIYLRLSMPKGKPSINFTYRIQLEHAKQIKDISESLHDVLGIIKALFIPLDAQNVQDGQLEFSNMVRSFQLTSLYFDRLCTLEDVLNIVFDPSKIGDIDSSAEDVYELYLLLVEKKAVRLNAKLTSTTSTGITILDDSFEHELGAPVDLVFTGENTYVVCGQNICVYTANFLTNAIVKEFKTDEDGTTRLLYGDTDSNPMYISYKGFLSEEAAHNEMKELMPNKRDEYEDAQTVEKYILQCRAQIG